MQFSYDRTGFPLISIPQAGLEVQLLPVTKVQLERFLAEPNAFGDTWYESVLALNPRRSYRRFTAENRERIFLTGILPEEATAFARWMGDGFDIPTVQEWRSIYAALRTPELVRAMLLRSTAEPAGIILQQLWGQLQPPRSLLDLSLMHGGVVEWVRQGKTWIGLGAPRPEFHPNLFNPLSDEVRPIRPAERVPYFGFRLVRRVE